MKRTATIVFATSLLSAPVLAQSDSPQAGQGEPATAVQRSVQTARNPVPSDSESFIAAQSDNQMRAEELIGADVRQASGEKIGKIQDLVIDENGRLVGVVVSVGGFLGFGDKEVALPWNKLEPRPLERLAVATVDKDELEQAPGFKNREQVAAERRMEEFQKQREAGEAAGGLGAPAAGTLPQAPAQQTQ